MSDGGLKRCKRCQTSWFEVTLVSDLCPDCRSENDPLPQAPRGADKPKAPLPKWIRRWLKVEEEK